MSGAAAELARRVEDRSATVAVIGLGHVGLPLALTVAGAGFPVLGFDTDAVKIDSLECGESYIDQFAGPKLAGLVADGKLTPTGDFDRLGEADVLLICVPTPLGPEREPDLQFVDQTTEAIRRRLRPGQLVILESTTYPGTTEERLAPSLASTGLDCGSDFFLAYSPEREDPGNPDFRTRTIPKVVAGVDVLSGDLAESFYSSFVPRVIRTSTARAAEATKLFENIFRAVNIALVNELKLVYEAMDIDVWEVLDAAETKPFGFMRFNPGPGWGGHCIPVDPFYLTWKAAQHGMRSRFIELAGEINIAMPDHIVSRLTQLLVDDGLNLDGSRILILGLAYKKDVQDIRESPGMELLDRLETAGAEVSFHDPHIDTIPSMRKFPQYSGRTSTPLDGPTLASFDAVLLATDHSAVDYDLVLRHSRRVLDSRGLLPADAPNLTRV